MGINPTKYKVLAFMISAFFTGFAGGFYSHYNTYIIPYEVFSLGISIACLVMPIFGGLYTIAGPIIGTVLIKAIEEYLRVNVLLRPPDRLRADPGPRGPVHAGGDVGALAREDPPPLPFPQDAMKRFSHAKGRVAEDGRCSRWIDSRNISAASRPSMTSVSTWIRGRSSA